MDVARLSQRIGSAILAPPVASVAGAHAAQAAPPPQGVDDGVILFWVLMFTFGLLGFAFIASKLAKPTRPERDDVFFIPLGIDRD